MPKKAKGTWGGARKGAGRKPKGDRAGVPHRPRPEVGPGLPVLVKLKMLPHLPSLRGKKTGKIVAEAFESAADLHGARLCEFSVRAHRIHLIVEAEDETALMRAMKGLSVRLARGLNRLTGGSGRVMADRYETRVLRSPDEVKKVVAHW